jgi:hypothetical protein
MNMPYQGARAGTWNPMGSYQNVWNSSQSDGSVPWDVAQRLGVPMGSVYGYQNTSAGIQTGGGGQDPLYANTGNDAYINSALGRLRGTVEGRTLPYDETTKANLTSKAADMNAAAEASNAQDVQERIARSGGSMNDPAAQAALARLKSQRQGANATAAQSIESQAGVANFNAQQQAAGAMGDMRLSQARVDPNLNGPATRGNGTGFGASMGGSGMTPMGGATAPAPAPAAPRMPRGPYQLGAPMTEYQQRVANDPYTMARNGQFAYALR